TGSWERRHLAGEFGGGMKYRRHGCQRSQVHGPDARPILESRLSMKPDVAQVFLPAGSGDFPAARWNGGLERLRDKVPVHGPQCAIIESWSSRNRAKLPCNSEK